MAFYSVIPHNGCWVRLDPPGIVTPPPPVTFVPPPIEEPKPASIDFPPGGGGRRPEEEPKKASIDFPPGGGRTPQPEPGADSSAPIPNPQPANWFPPPLEPTNWFPPEPKPPVPTGWHPHPPSTRVPKPALGLPVKSKKKGRRKRFIGGPDRSKWFTKAIYNPEGTSSGVVWSYKGSFDEGYPWNNGTLNKQNYPTPGMFYDANNTLGAFRFTGVDSFVIAAVGSALSMAGLDTSLATAKTEAGRRLRRQMLDLIQCSKFNDGLYGTVTATKISPNGRGILWDGVHNDVFAALSEGNSPARAVDVDGKRLPQYIEAASRPFVWVPAVNLDILTSRAEISVDGMSWEDGVSTLEPPPGVRALKISLSDVRLPGGVGCPSMFIPNPGRRRAYTQAQSYWQRKTSRQACPQGQHACGSSAPGSPPICCPNEGGPRGIVFTLPTKG